MSDMYKRALKRGLRIRTPVGNVAVEDLFNLSLKQLDQVAMGLRRQIKGSEEETLFDKKDSMTDEKLAYDIVVDVFKTKQADEDAATKRQATLQRNARIRELMARKQDEALAEKSVEELEALLNQE